MNDNEQRQWAAAIARRLSDEWYGSQDFPEATALLRAYLEKSLANDSESVAAFIGTGIIEEDYFSDDLT